jgi:hypothetical protein
MPVDQGSSLGLALCRVSRIAGGFLRSSETYMSSKGLLAPGLGAQDTLPDEEDGEGGHRGMPVTRPHPFRLHQPAGTEPQ